MIQDDDDLLQPGSAEGADEPAGDDAIGEPLEGGGDDVPGIATPEQPGPPPPD